jgi:hypothetical protein
VQNGGKPVDAVDVETTWQSLVSRPGAQLIDVRTRAEWTYVGIPDLGAIGKRAVLVTLCGASRRRTEGNWGSIK